MQPVLSQKCFGFQAQDHAPVGVLVLLNRKKGLTINWFLSFCLKPLKKDVDAVNVLMVSDFKHIAVKFTLKIERSQAFWALPGNVKVQSFVRFPYQDTPVKRTCSDKDVLTLFCGRPEPQLTHTGMSAPNMNNKIHTWSSNVKKANI